MKTTMKICVLASALVLGGCSSIPKETEVTKIDLGMTVDQVNAILGQPKTKSANKKEASKMCLGYEVIQYQSITLTLRKNVNIGFDNGRVEKIDGC